MSSSDDDVGMSSKSPEMGGGLGNKKFVSFFLWIFRTDVVEEDVGDNDFNGEKTYVVQSVCIDAANNATGEAEA